MQPEHAEQEGERPENFSLESTSYFVHIVSKYFSYSSSAKVFRVPKLCAILLKPYCPFTCWNSASKTSRCACIRRNSELKAPQSKRTIAPSACRRLARYLEKKWCNHSTKVEDTGTLNRSLLRVDHSIEHATLTARDPDFSIRPRPT